MSHNMRKPVFAICEQQRRTLACASAQSDQHICCSLPGHYNIYNFYNRNFKPLPSFCGCTGRFVSYLVANPQDRFSLDEAQILSTSSAFSVHCACFGPPVIAINLNWISATHVIWAGTWQNQQSECVRSEDSDQPEVSAQSDQSPCCPHEETLGP